MILVFGSGKNDSIEKIAKSIFGAVSGSGKSGFCYAIPVYQNGCLVTLEDLQASIAEFIDFAKNTPSVVYYMTNIACNAGEYKNEQIAPFFADAPENVMLPGVWVNVINMIKRKPSISRVIITGPRWFSNYKQLKEKVDFYISRLNRDNVEIISGGETGTDAMGGMYAKENNITLRSPHFDIEKFWRQAGYHFCNKLWVMYATHMIIFYDEKQIVLKDLLEVANESELRIAIVRI